MVTAVPKMGAAQERDRIREIAVRGLDIDASIFEQRGESWKYVRVTRGFDVRVEISLSLTYSCGLLRSAKAVASIVRTERHAVTERNVEWQPKAP